MPSTSYALNWLWFVLGIVGMSATFFMLERLGRKAEVDINARGGPGRLYFWTVFLMPGVGLFAWWFARKRHARIDYIRASGRGREG